MKWVNLSSCAEPGQRPQFTLLHSVRLRQCLDSSGSVID